MTSSPQDARAAIAAARQARLDARAALHDGRPDDAIFTLQNALAVDPEDVDLLLMLGEANLAASQPEPAETAFTAALALRPRDNAARRGFALAALAQGKRDTALDLFRQLQAALPYDKQATHMVAALSSATGSADYIADLFDTYADDFDTHLTGTLGYRVPELLRDLLLDHLPQASLLDLGCGTGLAGLALQHHFTEIDGIDIAPRMIAKARERDLYRHLVVGDVTDPATTNALAGPYDVIVAADVFVYIGQLETVFAALSDLLKPDGLLAFSVERDDAAPITLRASGRFAYAAHYIEALATSHGFAIVTTHDATLRQERDTPVMGLLYLLRRK